MRGVKLSPSTHAPSSCNPLCLPLAARVSSSAAPPQVRGERASQASDASAEGSEDGASPHHQPLRTGKLAIVDALGVSFVANAGRGRGSPGECRHEHSMDGHGTRSSPPLTFSFHHLASVLSRAAHTSFAPRPPVRVQAPFAGKTLHSLR